NSRRLIGPGQTLTPFDFLLDAMSIRLDLPQKRITRLTQNREIYFQLLDCASLNRHPYKAAKTSSACSSGFTLGQIFLMRPSGPIRKVTRCVPMYFRPMKLFWPQTPYASTIFLSSSARSVNGSLNFSTNLSCDFT